MSIAISIVLHPSKMMRSCAALFAFLLACIGIYVAGLNHLSVLIRSILFVICSFVAWRSFLYNQKIAKTNWHISIDGHGQLRCRSSSSSASQKDHPLFNLAPGTTLWAHALFLRLTSQENNGAINVVVLPDSLCKDEFRRLSVACKWIIAQSESPIQKS